MAVEFSQKYCHEYARREINTFEKGLVHVLVEQCQVDALQHDARRQRQLFQPAEQFAWTVKDEQVSCCSNPQLNEI